MDKPLKPPKPLPLPTGHGNASLPADSFQFPADPWSSAQTVPVALKAGTSALLFDAVLLLEPRARNAHAASSAAATHSNTPMSRVVWAFTGAAGASASFAAGAAESTTEALKSLDLDAATLDQFCFPDADELRGRRYTQHATKAGLSLSAAKREAARCVSGMTQQQELQQEQQQQSNLNGFEPPAYYGSQPTAAATAGTQGTTAGGARLARGAAGGAARWLPSGHGRRLTCGSTCRLPSGQGRRLTCGSACRLPSGQGRRLTCGSACRLPSRLSSCLAMNWRHQQTNQHQHDPHQSSQPSTTTVSAAVSVDAFVAV